MRRSSNSAICSARALTALPASCRHRPSASHGRRRAPVDPILTGGWHRRSVAAARGDPEADNNAAPQPRRRLDLSRQRDILCWTPTTYGLVRRPARRRLRDGRRIRGRSASVRGYAPRMRRTQSLHAPAVRTVKRARGGRCRGGWSRQAQTAHGRRDWKTASATQAVGTRRLDRGECGQVQLLRVFQLHRSGARARVQPLVHARPPG